MSAQGNVARPYAQALFELAREQDDLSGWDDRLRLLAAVAADPALVELAGNPRVSPHKLVGLIVEVCGERLNVEGRNLVRLVVRNGRLGDLADIAEAYAARRAEAEKVVSATMLTATAMADEQQRKFSDALRKKLGRDVQLEFQVDEELIGGAVIRAGDWVVDGSVRAQLEQLVGAVSS